MSTVAPDALYGIYKLIDPYFTTSKIGGVVGDSKHGNGYHLSREDLLRRGLTGDYSIQCPADKRGPANAAAGIDITFGSLAELVTMHKRLRAACTPDANGNYDPRVECVREVIGTLDGKNVSGYNRVATGSGSRSRLGWVSSGFSDSSHLWHEHVSVLRGYVEDVNAMRGLAEVMAGVAPGTLGWVGEGAVAPVEPPPFVWDGKSFPGAERFGEGVSGPWVTWLGERLVAHGYTGYKVGPGPDWGAADLAGVKWAQEQQGFTGDDADGIPGETTWAWLAADPVVVPPPATPPPVVEPPKPEPKPDPTVKHTTTVTFGNPLWDNDKRAAWPARKADVVRDLLSVKPDVFMVCEIDPDQAEDIYNLLPSGWAYWRVVGGGHYGPLAIFWKQSIYERDADAVEHEFSDNDSRYLLCLPLVHKASGQTVWFDVTHFENDGDKDTNGGARRKLQATELANLTKKGKRIGGGDINSTTAASSGDTSKPRVIFRKAGLTMLTQQSASKVKNRAYASHHTHLNTHPKGAWIDDMWWRGVTFNKGGLILTNGSDHNFPWVNVTL